MFMWIGLEANPDFIEQVFGVPSSVQVNTEVARLPELENPLNEAVRSVIDQIKAQHHHCMRVSDLNVYCCVSLSLRFLHLS